MRPQSREDRVTVTDPVATIGRIGRRWGWFLVFGILTVALGICAVAWPAITLLAAAIVVGVQLSRSRCC
jgi:uncharacterized membrane protein HdeD (DUF308 family)